MSELIWKNRDKDGNPNETGIYRIMVSGDSESIDGHMIYSFDDYETWGVWNINEDEGFFKGVHDEEDFTIFAYYGPIIIPEYKVD